MAFKTSSSVRGGSSVQRAKTNIVRIDSIRTKFQHCKQRRIDSSREFGRPHIVSRHYQAKSNTAEMSTAKRAAWPARKDGKKKGEIKEIVFDDDARRSAALHTLFSGIEQGSFNALLRLPGIGII